MNRFRFPSLTSICFDRIQSFSRALALVVLAILVGTGSVCAVDGNADDKVTYDDHIKPLFQRRCGNCHNPDKRKADLDLTNYTNLMQGGASGEVIEPGDTSNSYLYMLVTHEETPIMPPGENAKLPDAELALIAKWIELGALENKGSKAQIKRPAVAMADPGAVLTKPAVVPIPPRLPLEPAVKPEQPPAITALATSPWAPVVAIGIPKEILLYRTDTHQLSGIIPFSAGQPTVLKFSRNGGLLLAAGGHQGEAGRVHLWDVASGQWITSVAEETDAILAADISPDHRLIAIGGPQKMVRVYATDSGELVYQIKKHTDWVTAIEFSPDGVLLATGDRNGGLFVWEAATGNEYLALKAHSDMVADVSWRLDSNVLASASRDASIRLWEMENGRQIKSWSAHGQGVTSVEFTRDGQIASCGRDQVAKLWKQDGAVVRQFEAMSDIATAVSFCNETGRLICGDWKGRLSVFQAADGKRLAEYSSTPPTLAERLAQSQAQLAAAQAKHEPLAKEDVTLKQQLAEMDKTIAATETTRAAAETKMAAANNEMKGAKTQLDAAVKQIGQCQQQLATIAKATPEIQQSFDRATQALAALPNDAELKTVTETLVAKLKSLETQAGQLNAQMGKATQQKTAMEARIQEMTQAAAAAKAEMDAAAKKVQELQAQRKPIDEKRVTVEQALQAAAAEIQKWQQQIARWQSEITFKQTLDQLNQQLIAAEQTLATEQSALAELEKKLAEIQQQVAAQKTKRQAAEQQANQIRAKIEELKSTSPN